MANFAQHKWRSRHAMRGMTLVELLVAATIGLIGIIIISQVLIMSESQKRTTTGGSDAQINGNLALFAMERDIRQAGFGIVTFSANLLLGCNTLAYNSARTSPQDFTLTMAPASILTSVSDSLTVVYGNLTNTMDGIVFSGAATSGADFPIKNAAGIENGELVVVYEAGKNCSLAQVTGFQPAALNSVIHANAGSYSYTNTSGSSTTATATFNKTGGLGVDYSASAILFDLGRNPTFKRYSVSGDKLIATSLLTNTSEDVADGIVQMKTQYGKDTDGNQTIDTWNTTAPVTAADWLQVRAIRVALLARSGQYEKTQVTTSAPQWLPGNYDSAASAGSPTAAQSFTMSNPADGTDWRNYRYRVYQTTIPMRNMIWTAYP